jgi:hypothetical protein
MTDISAKIIADSVSPDGKRMTTIQMRYPRFIHAESLTHRLLAEQPSYYDDIIIPDGLMYDPNLSRNARSSRAVPIEKMIAEVMENPVVPIHWGAAQKGMQAYAENDAMVDIGRMLGFADRVNVTNEQAWLMGRDMMVHLVQGFADAGYAKQVANRLLEPWLHIDTLVSATEWTNFLALRDHHAAEPHIQKLAQEVKLAMEISTPVLLRPGEWHLPYVEYDERSDIIEWAKQNKEEAKNNIFAAVDYAVEISRKLSVARCARISYTPFDGNGSIEKELERYDLLVGSIPLHASPAEHQATPDIFVQHPGWPGKDWEYPDLHGNLEGWIQFRKQLPNEHISEIAA